MKKFLRHFLLRPGEGPRFALAALAGLLQAAAFPKFDVAGLAWVAPGMLLASAAGAPGVTAFRAGLIGGLAFFLTTLHWLLHIPMNKLVPGTGWVALSAFLAFYPAVWVWLCWKCFPVQMAGVDGSWRGKQAHGHC